jgi:hypothetical protein
MPIISNKLQERILSLFGDREDAREMINAIQNIAPTGLPPYSQNFNATTDWSTDPNTGEYVITVLASVHGQGLFPTPQIYGVSGAVFDEVSVDQVIINNSGDVTFVVPSTPDARFAGKLIIA